MHRKPNLDLQRKLRMFNQVAAGIICLCSLAIGTSFSVLIGIGVIIAVLVFYKGD